jgi:hypothetical protein
MSRERLHKALTTLHSELENGGHLDDEDRILLEAVAEDVQRTLDEAEQDETLRGRVEQLATEFEARHPRTALLLTEMVETLSRMGI